MRFAVAQSALKRPDVISYEDIVSVMREGDYLGPDAKGCLWWIGATSRGLDVEVAAIATKEMEQ